jgi:aryl-alcohol dehydrogenase-like predicted oxidoreductase
VEAEKHEVKDHSLATLERQWAESRSRLGGHLRLYQVHSATLESGVLEDAGVLARLARLREEAGVEVGLSLSGPRQAEVLRRALGLRVDGRPVFGCVQATVNLLERSAEGALAEAHAQGWGVVVKEAVANGRLTPRGAGGAAEVLRAVAAAHRVAPDALALAWALSRPFASVVLSGAASVAQLQSNLGALAVPREAVEDGRLATLAEAPEAYWRERGALAWN